MPPVRNMDGSPVHQTNGWQPPPSLPVRKPAQVLDRGASGWPFLYSYKGDTVIVNTRPTKSKYQEALVVGEAQF